jgi:hypothetical protein
MSDFKEVSLGFAEFVSQLIQETFDAILSSQNYQLEKYVELESKLNLPDRVFVENFITKEEVETKKIEFFGFNIQKQMVVDESLNNFLFENFDSSQNLVFNNKLTNLGYDSITIFIENLIVENQKNILNSLINKSNVSNLVIDSGEISAKLELSNLFSEEGTNTQKQGLSDVKLKSLKKTIDKRTLLKKEFLLPTEKRKISVVNFKDTKTGKITVLIDKKEIDNINSSNFQIPNVRLSVKPTKLTESSNLYSEIKINFKTV